MNLWKMLFMSLVFFLTIFRVSALKTLFWKWGHSILLTDFPSDYVFKNGFQYTEKLRMQQNSYMPSIFPY